MNKQPETDEEWAEYLLKEVSEVEGDTEAMHNIADHVLLEFVKFNGGHELAEVWEKVPKWYA